MDRKIRNSITMLNIALAMTAAATIMNTYRITQLQIRVNDQAAARIPGPIIIDDPDGLCVYDAIREKVAPGSGTRKLTPEEIEAFKADLESFGGKPWKIVTPRRTEGR